MSFSIPSLKRMAVAQAIAHPADDLTKVAAQVRNMTERNQYLSPVADPDDGRGAMLYRPGDCLTAAVILRLWQAGLTDSLAFEAAALRMQHWYAHDTFPDWKPGDPVPQDIYIDQEYSPACHVLRDFCETGAAWSLRLDVRRHRITGAVRHVATLWRWDSALGNGSPPQDGEEPQSAQVIVLDTLLAQIAASTIYRKWAN